MIQSQFDAASRLGVSSSQQSAGEPEEPGPVQRSRKRRKTSPAVGDSIEVAANSPSADTPSSVEHQDSIVVGLGQADTGSPQADSTSKTNHVNDGTPSAKARPEGDEIVARPDHDKEETDTVNGDAAGEVVPLQDPGLPGDPLVPGLDTGTSTALAVLEPPNALSNNEKQEHGPPGPALAASETAQTQQCLKQSPVQNSTIPRASPSAQDCPDEEDKPRPPEPPQAQRAKSAQHPLSQAFAPSSGPSTPKQSSRSDPTTKTSSPLSSPPTELFDPFDEHSTQPPPSSSRPSSPVSEGGEGGSEREEAYDESEPSLSQEHFNRSSTFRRSLSTLKGRELFDAAIWADPLKTSVFYTFATNLRQKSRDASPTGCHHFISHLSKAGKMVRCYTQNIDLLEDKVGLSTRLLLGPGNRSRFSRTSAKNGAGSATPRNPSDHNPQAAIALPISDSDLSRHTCEHAMGDRASTGRAISATDQGAPFSLAEQVDVKHQRASNSDQDVAEGDSSQVRQCDSQPSGACGQEVTTNGPQAADPQTANANPAALNKPLARADSAPSTPARDRGVECVFLHGSLRALRCFQCGGVADWDEGNRELQTMSGSQPPCPRCEDATVARQERGKRALGVGKLRPDVVLYGEEHPESQQISTIIQHDISLAPDMLIVMGTSLKVHGLKTVVREFAKTVHNRRDGRVIFVNYTKPAESVWADIFDFWVEMDCDAWIEDLRQKKPIIWLPPGSVEEESRSTKRRRPAKDESEKKDGKKSKKNEDAKDARAAVGVPEPTATLVSGNVLEKKLKKAEKNALLEADKPAPKRPAAFRDCKQNAAYWTARIWSDLAGMTGREVAVPAPTSPSKTVPAARKAAIPSARTVPVMQGTVALAGPVKARRGPRTKNAKSKRTFLMADEASSDATAQLSGPPAKAAKPKKPRRSQLAPSGTTEQANPQSQPSLFKDPVTSVSSLSTPLAEDGVSHFGSVVIKQESVGGSAVSDEPVLVEVPVPNTGPNPYGEDNSILAAVKSNPRIRKPKAIFGETGLPSDPPSRLATPTNPKSKARAISQARKGKTSAKVEEIGHPQEVQQIQVATGDREDQISVLPKPLPLAQRLRIATNRPQPLQKHNETYTLPPMQPAVQAVDTGRRDSFLQMALGPSPATAPNAGTPAAYLEPIISPAPRDITPIMSPNHWRNRAFIFGDPLPNHFEPPRRPLDYTGVPQEDSPDNGFGLPVRGSVWSQLPPRPGPGPEKKSALEDGPQLCADSALTPDVSSAVSVPSLVDDSPSRQLQRESDAATALSQMSQRAIYDNRQFAI